LNFYRQKTKVKKGQKIKKNKEKARKAVDIVL